ncbi:hypothetical protein RJ641_025798 [Dillenia turbinata]|uniref:Uncharacterized protein n=1 Tax=Dillenia turbinata TaxID=194707 RepID=A0AAN8WB71_9MAGN
MEELQKAYRAISNGTPMRGGSSSSSSSPTASGFSSVVSSDRSGVLINRPPRQAVSVLTCSKLCAFFFVAGVVVGFTLKRRVRRWASKLLRRMKDD